MARRFRLEGRARRDRHRIVAAVVLVVATALPAAAQPEQSVHRRGFVPAGDEVFEVVRQAFDLDASVPLDAREVERDEDDASIGREIVFTTQGGERVPGDLLLPKQGRAPYPAVLLLHGLGNDRHRWWREDRRALADRLLAAGIAVFAIDLELHGDRAWRNDYQSPVYLTLGDTRFVRNRDMVIQSTLDARRALALLREREEVDGSRLGVVGYSMGAMIATFLAVLEPRLAGVVACALPTTEQPQTAIDPFQFAPRLRVPIRLEIGRDDWLSSPEDARTFLDLVPGADRELAFYDAGHVLPPQFATDAAEWLIERTRERPPATP